MKINQGILAARLSKIKTALPTKPMVECIKGVLLGDGVMTATDLEITLKAPLDMGGMAPFILPERAVEMILSLPNIELDLSHDGAEIILQAGNITNKFNTTVASDFPKTDIKEDSETLILDWPQLKSAMQKVSHAISDNDAKPIFTGILLEGDGERLNLVACDGFRMAWAALPCTQVCKVILPRNAVKNLLKLGDGEKIVLQYSKKRASFTLNDVVLSTRLLEGEFVKYKTIFPQGGLGLTLQRGQLMEAIHRGSILCADGRKPLVKLSLGEDLTLTTASSYGDYDEHIQLKNPCESPMVIGFNGKLLLEALRCLEGEEITLNLSSPTTAATIIEGDVRVMVLPIRLRG